MCQFQCRVFELNGVSRAIIPMVGIWVDGDFDGCAVSLEFLAKKNGLGGVGQYVQFSMKQERGGRLFSEIVKGGSLAFRLGRRNAVSFASLCIGKE